MAYLDDDHAFHRHITPPMGADHFFDPHSAGTERTFNSCPSYRASPDSVNTHLTTPPRSPTQHHAGPVLLPKIRSQDQVVDPVDVQPRHVPSRSITSTGFPLGFNEHRFQQPLRHDTYHRSLSPPDVGMNPNHHLSSNPSHIDNCRSRTVSPMPSALLGLQRRPSLAHSRSTSMSSVYTHSHARSQSGNLDAAAVRKYICPSRHASPSAYAPIAQSHLQPSIPPPSTHAHSRQSSYSVAPTPPPAPDFLAPELQFDSYATPPPATTLLSYLTAPNPSPALVRRTPAPNRMTDNYFWWDVRNLRTWSDFSLSTIQSIPDLSSLLDLPIPEPALPIPPTRLDLHPDTLPVLAATCAAHYLPKVNGALRVALGPASLAYSTPPPHPSKSSPNTAPDFIATAPHDADRTLFGASRGRIVGLVKSFAQFHSGMRAAAGPDSVKYQRELAHLHLLMREHACRYAFILTEIELVVVRLGVEHTPYYGLLEVATAVPVAATGPGALSVPLALTFLAFLARDATLPGHPGWRVDVGGPAALTRQKVMPRDSWMLKVEGRERRDAKRVRGWVMPEESLSRREVGRGRRVSAK